MNRKNPNNPFRGFMPAPGGSDPSFPERRQVADARPTPIELPYHLYPPVTAQTIDIKNAFSVSAGTTDFLVLRFEAPEGSITRFTHYAIVNDGLAAADFDFYPRVDNNRIYRYHGDPLSDFRIYLGTGPDLGNESLVSALITLQPRQVLTWHVTNRSAVDTLMAVRMVGYVDRTQNRAQERFGG